MSGKFRRPAPQTEQEFVMSAATAMGAGQGRADPPAEPSAGDAPNPRIMKQVNIDMPEPLFVELRALIATIPQMSMRRFLLEAAQEKRDRILKGE